MHEEEQRPGVRLHRARNVAEHDQLPRYSRARSDDPAKRISAGSERLPNRRPQVELAAAVMAAEPARAPCRPLGRDRRDQLACPVELRRSHRGEVLRPEDLFGAVAARLARLLRGVRVCLAALAEVLAAENPALARRDGGLEGAERLAQEPRLERSIEDVDLLAARHEV